MKNKLALLVGTIVISAATFADNNSASAPATSVTGVVVTPYSSGIDSAYGDVGTRYYSNPQLTSESISATNPLKPGWYGHKWDVTYIKLIQVGNDIGLSILFNTRGYFCPVDRYLLFKKVSESAFNYTVANGCVATISLLPNTSFKFTVNSRTKCFEEPTYHTFCNGDLNIHATNEQSSRLFVDKVFVWQKDQDDDDYDWNDD